jgi:D-psicose/D-tagatose/L-ribulose 3-epimerase
MREQRFEGKNIRIQNSFRRLKEDFPERCKSRLNLSWSNWGFGRESLADSAARLQRAGVPFIELHGNHYGPDLGYQVEETLKTLGIMGCAHPAFAECFLMTMIWQAIALSAVRRHSTT